MRREDIARILDNHSVGNSTVGGRVIAEEWSTYREENIVSSHCELVDVTDYSLKQLRDWLGY